MKIVSQLNFRASLWAVLLAWLTPRTARAEDSIRYKYQDYSERDGRVAVEVNSAAIEKDLGTAMH